MKAYNQLTEEDKQSVIKAYYEMIPFKEIPIRLGFSERSVSRVLKECAVNTHLKNRYTLNENYFEVIDTEQKAYWLGFIYADGFVGDEKFNNVVIALKETDIDHLKMFAKHIEYSGEIRVGGRGGFEGSQQRCTINFSNVKMASDLRRLGLYPGKSKTMESIPDIKPEYVRHFIRGYFDGDGCVHSQTSTSYHKGKKYEYKKAIVSIIGTLKFVGNIARELPFMHRIRSSKTEEMKYIEYYGVKEIPRIYDYFYKDATVYLQRKKDRFDEVLGPSIEQSVEQTPNMLEHPESL